MSLEKSHRKQVEPVQREWPSGLQSARLHGCGCSSTLQLISQLYVEAYITTVYRINVYTVWSNLALALLFLAVFTVFPLGVETFTLYLLGLSVVV